MKKAIKIFKINLITYLLTFVFGLLVSFVAVFFTENKGAKYALGITILIGVYSIVFIVVPSVVIFIFNITFLKNKNRINTPLKSAVLSGMYGFLSFTLVGIYSYRNKVELLKHSFVILLVSLFFGYVYFKVWEKNNRNTK